MAKPKKLPSGNWRIRVFIERDENGKQQFKSFTAETKAEVLYLAAEFEKNREQLKITAEKPKSMTVREALEKYIARAEAFKKSPTTIQSYRSILNYAFQDLMPVPILEIDESIAEEAILNESKRKTARTNKTISPKTLRNEWMIIAAALKRQKIILLDIELPESQIKKVKLPKVKDVSESFVGTSIELPCMLAFWLGLSMEEIRGIKCSDIDGNLLDINQVIVDVGTEHIVKDDAKTQQRHRTHEIPPKIMDLINDTDAYKKWMQQGVDGFIIPLTRSQIYGRWQTICEHNHFKMSFHQLRHMNTSIMELLKVPDAYQQQRNGWSNSYTKNKHYRHALDEGRLQYDKVINDYMNSLFGGLLTQKVDTMPKSLEN